LRFAHIADTHIKNLKYHYEYSIVFEQLYEKLKTQNVDYIIHCGDIAHTKTQLSPEFVEMATNFFRNLGDIAPTYIILGNHDGNLKNSSRQDAITPIIAALAHPNIHLIKNSGEVSLNDDFALNVLSVFDTDNWVDPTNYDRVNIALYHGSISGCKTDIGWTMEFGEYDISIFDNFDYAFLGDIHKTNQALDVEGKIRYAGSTVQQNFGETNDKGYLIWDVKDKDNYTCEHHVLLNPKPFITIELTPKGKIPKNTNIELGSRLRLVSNNNLPLDVMRKAVDVANRRFKPESLNFLNRSSGQRGSVEDMASLLEEENLRDITVQEDLIKTYLTDYEVEDETLEEIYALNRKYNSDAEEGEEISRNVNWKLNKFEWDNLFNYGENNCINFERLNGTVGIFGKNFSGKSSIIDALLFTIFNSTSKNERKNYNVINQNKESCKGSVEFQIGDNVYVIERESEKYVKKLKGEETQEAKTKTNFEMTNNITLDVESLNGMTRNGTDKIIRKTCGTLEDFLLTSMSSQLGSLAFINEGSTRRKEILAKFLDLEIFESKFKMAKAEIADVRGALKNLEGKEYDEDIKQALTELEENEEATTDQKEKCDVVKTVAEQTSEEIRDLEEKIASIPAEVINIKEVTAEKAAKQKQLEKLGNSIETLLAEQARNQENLDKIGDFLNNFDLEELNMKKELVNNKEEKITGLFQERSHLTLRLSTHKKKTELLDEVPCGDQYPDCKFICNAHTSKKEIPDFEEKLEKVDEAMNQFDKEIESLNPKRIRRHMENYEKVVDKERGLKEKQNEIKLNIERNKNKTTNIEHTLEKLEAKIVEYEENRDVIENLEALLKDCNKKKKAKKASEKKLQACDDAILELYKQHGSLEQKHTNLLDQKQEMLDLRKQYSAYDLFMRCMHSNGISLDIIKRKLPVINDEVIKVLANVVDFEVFFESEGNKLDIFIKHPKYEARPIELGSGAEKTIAAMAIRLALLSVSSLPKSNLFILDEPATALDADNMEGFVRILDMVKNYYPIVLLISHIDSLKDIVDMTIDIDKVEGFAYVNQ
jgi:DNA repair exonuclease SbcCD ATPase subunit/DNA repair exonuclease SbcCD nuclease subunit